MSADSEAQGADAGMGDGELDADVSAAVAEANRAEYGPLLTLFEALTRLAPKDRLTAKELVKRLRSLDEQIKSSEPIGLGKLRTRTNRTQ